MRFPRAMVLPEGSETTWNGMPTLDFIYSMHGLGSGNCATLEKLTEWFDLDIGFLSSRERYCMESFYFEGKRIREIAVDMGVTDGTVKRWLFRGRGKLLKYLR